MPQPDLSSLFNTLNTSGLQTSNNALYQTIYQLIKFNKDIQDQLSSQLSSLKDLVDGGKLPNKLGGLLGVSAITRNDDHVVLPNSREAVAGPGINISYGSREAVFSAGATPIFFPEDSSSDFGGIIVPGPAGAAGSAGATGATGPQGPFGIPSVDGEDGLDSYIPGQPGPQGPAGSTGAAGTAIPLQGPQGEPGDEGMPIPGPQGPIGATGIAGGMTFIAETVCDGTSGSVTFSSIPNTYRHLIIFYNARGSAALSSVSVSIQFNGDTGANYDGARMDALSGAVNGADQVAQTSAFVAFIPGSSSPSNYPGGGILFIPDYAGNTFFKSVTSLGAGQFVAQSTTNIHFRGGAVWWRNVNPISSVTILSTSGGNFVSNSKLSLYGVP